MKAILKDQFSDADLKSGYQLVTSRSFSIVKNWDQLEVTGDKYLVSKAVKLGAKCKPKPKKKAK